MLSILMLTWNRYEETKKVLEQNLSNMGLPYYELLVELLVCDQGSDDKRVIELVESYKPEYFRKNEMNEGVAKAFNQLYMRSSGDYIAMIGNDILLPNNWAKEAIHYLSKIPNAGLCGFDWGHGSTPPVTWKLGQELRWLNAQLNRVFGCWVFPRSVIDTIGFMHEGFDVYGLEDSDFNERINLAGFNSFYLRDARSEHIGIGASDTGPYREMKNASMARNATIFGERAGRFATHGVVEPLPDLRNPLRREP